MQNENTIIIQQWLFFINKPRKNKGEKTMTMKRCSQGHYYDPDKHRACPACGISDLDIGKTKIKQQSDNIAHDFGANRTKKKRPSDKILNNNAGNTRRAGIFPPNREEEEGRTIGLVRKKTGIDPVVGWLICIEGPDKGRDYRIKSEKNFIGRSAKMNICIQNDSSISRENHAVISFNPKKSVFKVHPGDSHGLVYLNDEDVDIPTALKSYDLIELGETKLVFIPFCGENFQW